MTEWKGYTVRVFRDYVVTAPNGVDAANKARRLDDARKWRHLAAEGALVLDEMSEEEAHEFIERPYEPDL